MNRTRQARRFLLRPLVHDNRMLLVDSTSDVGVTAGAKDGCRAGIRVYAGISRPASMESSGLRRGQFSYRARRRRIRLVESSLLAAQDEGAEFERSVNILEEHFSILKIEQAAHPSVSRTDLKNLAAVLSA